MLKLQVVFSNILQSEGKVNNVVITGGSGFLGQNVVKYLATKKINGIILDKNKPTDTNVVKLIDDGLWTFYQCDFSNTDSIKKFSIPKESYLIHIASKVSTTNSITLDCIKEIQTQVSGVFPLLNHLSDSLSGIIFTSTLETYGFPEKLPLDEAHPTNPFNLYGAEKLTLEYFLDIYCRKENIPLSILRLPQIYGNGDIHAKAIPTFIKNCLNGESSTLVNNGLDIREFVHVDDIALAILLSIQKKASGIFNITGGRAASIGETLNIIQELCGTNLEVINKKINKDQLIYYFDISKAKNELEYEPSVSFENGLKSEIEWYKEALK